MDVKWPACGPGGAMVEEGLDFRTSDGSWWAVRIRLEDEGVLRVMFRGFSPSEDELFKAKHFQSIDEVEEFRSRFRRTVLQLQDGDCDRVIEGMYVCASNKFKEDDVRFFDAVVEEVNFSEHKCIKGVDVCTCTFVVLWLGGPLAGQKTSKGVEDICFLQPADLEIDPILDQFIGMSMKRFRTKKELNSEVCHFQKPSSTGVELPKPDQACSTQSKNTSLSPCKPKTPACPVLNHGHAFNASENEVECTFCGRAYSYSLKVMYHLAGIGGHIEACSEVPVYWRRFYSRYICASDSAPRQKPRELIVEEIQKELAAEVEAGHIPFPPDQDTVTVVPSHKRSSSSRGSTGEVGLRGTPVLEHSIGKEVKVPKKMKGSATEKTVQSRVKTMINDRVTKKRCWEHKIRMRLQRCFQCYDIPNKIVQNPNFVAACRLIAAAAKDGHDGILPTPEEMGVWILSDSDDDEP